jgi:hypothetical protein
MQQILPFLNLSHDELLTLRALTSMLFCDLQGRRRFERGVCLKKRRSGRNTMAKYLQCSECGKLAFYYDDFVGTEKPFYRRFMRYPEGEAKHEPPRCFTCGAVPRLIHENIKEEKAAAKH